MRGFRDAMRRLAGLLAVVALAAVLVPLPVAHASADLPVWHVGDSWTYVGNGFAAPIGSGTFRYLVVGTDTMAEDGDAGLAYHVEVWANATGASPARAADEWYRVSDLAIVRLTLDFVSCGSSACTNSTVSDVPNPILPLHFPLSAGDAWSATTVVSTHVLDQGSGLEDWFNYTGAANDSVGADVDVAVPAGSFTAAPLTEDYSGNAVVLSLSYASEVVRDFSPAVGNAVDERDYNSNGSIAAGQTPSAQMDLVAFTYTPPASSLRLLGVPLGAWLMAAGAIAAAVLLSAAAARRRQDESWSPPAGVPHFSGPRSRGRGPRRP